MLALSRRVIVGQAHRLPWMEAEQAMRLPYNLRSAPVATALWAV
jgi:hypothetical protein